MGFFRVFRGSNARPACDLPNLLASLNLLEDKQPLCRFVLAKVLITLRRDVESLFCSWHASHGRIEFSVRNEVLITAERDEYFGGMATLQDDCCPRRGGSMGR